MGVRERSMGVESLLYENDYRKGGAAIAAASLCCLAVAACASSTAPVRSSSPGSEPLRARSPDGAWNPSSAAPAVRSGTAPDIVAAVAAQAAEPLVVALPLMGAGLAATVRVAELAARSLPELLSKALCEGIPGPVLAPPGARFEGQPARSGESASWRFQAFGSLAAPRPGPIARPPSAAETMPVEVELHPSSEDVFVQLVLRSGGWAICAMPSLEVDVDGTPLDELPGAQDPIDLAVNADTRAVHVTAALPESLTAALLTADRLAIRWETGSATLRPSQSPAARQLAARLEEQDPLPEP